MSKMKKELVTLTHLNQIINDFVDIMKEEVIEGLDPSYFVEICRDIGKIIDDNPMISNYHKRQIDRYIVNQINFNVMSSNQGAELAKLTDFIGTQIDHLRQHIMAEEG